MYDGNGSIYSQRAERGAHNFTRFTRTRNSRHQPNDQDEQHVPLVGDKPRADLKNKHWRREERTRQRPYEPLSFEMPCSLSQRRGLGHGSVHAPELPRTNASVALSRDCFFSQPFSMYWIGLGCGGPSHWTPVTYTLHERLPGRHL